MRADKLEFNISYSDSAYPDNASKLRVFCYMKNGGYAFGDEFDDLTIATFDSNRTSKYSGYGTITIQLLDAEENLINSANVICKIIESNSTTPFIASPDFTEQSKQEVQAIVDNGKAQIEKAVKEAKEEIDNWSDQTSRFAKNESDISDLQLFKANTGALHFDGGYLSCSGLANKQIPKENTIAFRWKIDAQTFENLENYYRIIGRQLLHYTLFKSGNVVQLTVMYDDNTSQHVSVPSSNVADGKWHNIVIISTISTFDFYVDNVLLKSANKNKSNDFIIPSGSFIVSDSTKTKSIGSIADVCYFNFDITSADASYTLEDYQQGKPIPPSLLQSTFYTDAPIVVSRTTPLVAGEIGGGLSLADGVYTRTKEVTSNSYTSHYLAVRNDGLTFPAGTIVDVSIGLFQTLEGSGYFGGVAINYGDSTYSEWKLSSTSGGKASFVATKPFRLIAVRFRDVTGKNVFSISPTDTSNAIEVRVNGTILALEDYTIENGTSQIVFDYSGNNNDATITGIVKGDNDNRVQKLTDYIKSFITS